MKVQVTTNFLFPNLEEELTKAGYAELLQPIQEELQEFLEHATEYHLAEHKQDILGAMNEFLENHQIMPNSVEILRKLPLNAIDFYCFADEELMTKVEKKYHEYYEHLQSIHPKWNTNVPRPIFKDAATLWCELRKKTETFMKYTSPIIFLDFDGVLNTDDYYCELKGKGEPTDDEYGTLFSPESVNNLSKIIEATGAIIVATSAWRYQGLEQLQKMWIVRDMPGHLVDITPLHTSDETLLHADLSKMDSFNPADFWGKGKEIEAYLKEKRLTGADTPLAYVILDDIKDVLPSQERHFIRINPKVGITEDDARNVILLLRQINKFPKS